MVGFYVIGLSWLVNRNRAQWKLNPFQWTYNSSSSSVGKTSWIKAPQREMFNWTDLSSIPDRGIGGRKKSLLCHLWDKHKSMCAVKEIN